MATLLKNVFAAEQWWGPAYGNADAVPQVVAAAMDLNLFDEPPGLGDLHQEPPATAPDLPPIEASKVGLAAGFDRLGVSEKMAEVPGFEWLAAPDAQAAVELLEESAVSQIPDVGAESGSTPANDDSGASMVETSS